MGLSNPVNKTVACSNASRELPFGEVPIFPRLMGRRQSNGVVEQMDFGVRMPLVF